MASCVRCRKPANPAFSIQHDDTSCKHWTHVDCNDGKTYDELDFDKCDACLGKIDTSAPLLPDHEPTTRDGRDYIGQPLEQGVFAKLRRKIPAVFSRDQTKTTSNDPFLLLRLGPIEAPVDWMMREKNIGLQHMLSHGVTIDDFVNNGYDWDQLKLYQDLSNKGKDRRILTLQALKVTPEHFRAYPTALPVVDMELTGADLKNYFGLEFPQDGPMLTSPTADDWRASDVIRMGLRMDDLLEMGMCYLEHYMNLEPSAEEEKALGANIVQIKALKKNSDDLAAHVQEQERLASLQQQQQQPKWSQPQPQLYPTLQVATPPTQSVIHVPVSSGGNRFIAQAPDVNKLLYAKNKNKAKRRGVHQLSDK